MKQMKMIIFYIFQLEFILHIVGKHGTRYAGLTIYSKFKMAAKKQNGCFKTIKESNRKLYPQIIPVYPIWTKISMSMLVTPKNESIEELLIFLKIQDGGLWSKIQN